MFFLLLNIVLKLPLVFLNQAEYTDGVLQVTQFSDYRGIYPPLYTALVWPFSFLLGNLYAARFISVLFSSLAVIPLYLMARRTFGMRAAVGTALIYTFAPVALRWAPRMMTDATFSFFFWFCCERIIAAQGSDTKEELNSTIIHASILGALAALTRYQGLLLVVPVLFIVSLKWKRQSFLPLKGLAAVPLFGLVFLWDAFAGNIHGQQFLERSAALGPLKTFIFTAEPFILTWPYFLTYPIAILAAIGLCLGRGRPKYKLLPLTLFVLSVLLIFQSLFASFQERYFLPLFGLFYIWAGLGLAIMDDRSRRKYPFFRPYFPIIAVTWSLFISFIVLFGGRATFGDVAAASKKAQEIIRNQEEGKIYTNEIYRRARPGQQTIGANKVSFFSKTEAEYLVITDNIPPSLNQGDIIILTSRDTTGNELSVLSTYYNLNLMEEYEATVIPVFPDIMTDRSIEQSPVAFLYRYIPQTFVTRLYKVEGRR